MKAKKNYNIIIASNGSKPSITITLSQKKLQAMLFTFAAIAFGLVVFLTDYFSLNVDQWKLKSLTKENQTLKNKFYSVENKMKNLESEMQQLHDFSKKLKLITTISTDQNNSHNMGYGKISQSSFLALSKPTQNRQLASTQDFHNPGEGLNQNLQESNPRVKPLNLSENELEVRIKTLEGKSQLVKQDTWMLLTKLSKLNNFINNTPSIHPVKGWVSSKYGLRNETFLADHQPYFHRGLDIASMHGEPVLATADGKIAYTGYDKGYGNVVIIDHGFNLRTYYAHLSKIETEFGVNVRRGEVIAAVGNTGKSTGPHLHYEVRIFGNPVNPENYILSEIQ